MNTIQSILARVAAAILRFPRWLAMTLAGVFGFYLLFGWLALPPILQTQSEKYILEKSGHHLAMDRPSFNPLLLRLHLRNLRLTEPDGKPLLSFRHLVIDLSITSLFRRAYVFDEIGLDGLAATVAVLPGNRLNWSALIDALSSKEKKSSELPRLIIRKFSLSEGRLDLADRRSARVQATRLVPINLDLTDLSSLPNEEGKYELTAKTSFGAKIHWDGEIALKPMSIAGSFSVGELALPKLASYLPLPEKIAAPAGMAALSLRYSAGIIAERFNLRVDHMALRVDGFRIQAKADPNASLAFGRIDLRGGQFDLRDRRVSLDSIMLSGGGLSAERSARGAINLLDLLPPKKPAPPPQAPSAAWHYRIAHLVLKGFAVAFRDRSTAPAADIAAQDVTAEVDNVSDDLKASLPVRFGFRLRDGGSFAADGHLVPANAIADLAVKLDALALTPAQPYIGRMAALTLIGGTLSGDGHVTFDGKAGQYAGSLAVNDLRILEAGSRRTFLAFKSLSATSLAAGSTQIAVRELVLDGLDTRFIIAKDKSINFTQVLRQPPKSASATAAAAPFPIRIDRLRIRRSALEFADQSLVLPFGAHIHSLHGTIINMSSRRGGAPARLELEGQIDDYGMARAAGQLDMFKPTDLLDIKVAFTNVEMTRLTPYSATFAGRRIDSGKLTLNLEYKITNRQLSGDNQIIMDKLVLGERVKSPTAWDLPLDLAIAILEDSDGRIDLGLPVSGSLDDPKFSYGGIIWKAIVNVLTKIATSPFRALGALFGGDEQMDGLAFEPGRPNLSPPEREKLVRFAEALNKRPNLSVAVHGTWSDADRLALQDLQLRRAVAGQLGLSKEGDPGLITPDQPNVKPVLEDLYADRFGGGALAALKDGFRASNPGQLPESTSGKVMAALTGVFTTKPKLSDRDLAGLKDADFHAVLYQKLRDAEVVSDAALQALAQARANGVMAQLRDAKAPVDRITILGAEKVDAEGKTVPLKLDMAPVSKPAPKDR